MWAKWWTQRGTRKDLYKCTVQQNSKMKLKCSHIFIIRIQLGKFAFISIHDETYNDAYPQQSLTSNKQVKPKDKLFEDLVDVAKAKSKTSPSKSESFLKLEVIIVVCIGTIMYC